MTQNGRMIGISGDPLAADDQQLSKRQDIFVLGRRDANRIGHGLADDGLFVRHGGSGGAIGQVLRYSGTPCFFLYRVPNLEGLAPAVDKHPLIIPRQRW